MRETFVISVILGVVAIVGCRGKPEVISGTVTLDGQPLPHALVTFVPTENTEGLGGGGRTDERGQFKLTPARDSLAPGKYRVVISRPLRPDGSPPDPNVPPIESDAKETLPAIYSSPDETRLTAEVSPEKLVQDFDLESKPKQ